MQAVGITNATVLYLVLLLHLAHDSGCSTVYVVAPLFNNVAWRNQSKELCCSYLLRSAALAGVRVHVAGPQHQRRQTGEPHHGFFQKFGVVSRWLADSKAAGVLNDDDLVVVTDGTDVIIQADIPSFRTAYAALGEPNVLIGGEDSKCYPG